MASALADNNGRSAEMSDRRECQLALVMAMTSAADHTHCVQQSFA